MFPTGLAKEACRISCPFSPDHQTHQSLQQQYELSLFHHGFPQDHGGLGSRPLLYSVSSRGDLSHTAKAIHARS